MQSLCDIKNNTNHPEIIKYDGVEIRISPKQKCVDLIREKLGKLPKGIILISKGESN
jgi:hypothetical protein